MGLEEVFGEMSFLMGLVTVNVSELMTALNQGFSR